MTRKTEGTLLLTIRRDGWTSEWHQGPASGAPHREEDPLGLLVFYIAARKTKLFLCIQDTKYIDYKSSY